MGAFLSGIEAVGSEVLGAVEIGAGGAMVVFGSLYLAEGIASGPSALKIFVPAGVVSGGALLAMDGLQRTGIWNWQKQFNVNWKDAFEGYFLGGVEVLGGAYLAWNGIGALSASASQFSSYKGVGYAVGAVFLGGGGFLIYDGYWNRLRLVLNGGHLVSSTSLQEYFADNTDSSLKYNVYRFTYTDPQTGSSANLGGNEYQKRCQSMKDALWIPERNQCAEKTSYQKYLKALEGKNNDEDLGICKAEQLLGEPQSALCRKLAGGPNTTQTLRDVFNIPIKDLTCAEWAEVNAVPDDWSQEAKDDFWSRIPKECRDRAEAGLSADYTPKNLDTDHEVDSGHWFRRDWGFLQWLKYQTGYLSTSDKIAKTQAAKYNDKKLAGEDGRLAGNLASKASLTDTLASLGYTRDQLEERIGNPEKNIPEKRDPYAPTFGKGKRDAVGEYSQAMAKYASGKKPPKKVYSVRNKV